MTDQHTAATNIPTDDGSIGVGSSEAVGEALPMQEVKRLAALRTDHARTVIIFIHGIGVQDRYQQLVSFTNGLRYTPKAGEFWVSRRGTDDTPQGQNVPLRIIPRRSISGCAQPKEFVDVDVCEVYWAPLLNGLTGWLAVLRWLGLTLLEFFKKFLKKKHYVREAEGRQTPYDIAPFPTAKTSAGKWVWQIGYFSIVSLLAFFLLWSALGTLLLTTDQLSNPKHRIIKTRAFILKDDFAARDLNPRDAALAVGVWQQGLSYVLQRDSTKPPEASTKPPKASTKPPEVIKGLSVDTGQLLKQIQLKDLLYGLGFVASFFWFILSVGSLFQLAYNLVKTTAKRKRFSQSHNGDEAERATTKCGKEQNDLRSAVIQRLCGFALSFVSLAVLLIFDNLSKPIIVLVLVPLGIFLLLRQVLNMGLTSILGDVEIYVTRNENNAKYRGREAVLERAQTTIEQVLQNPHYENVYIAGHSLGSVVGLDALRRRYNDYKLNYKDKAARERYEKIKGFITFGSPLEKTLLFFHRDDYRSEFLEFNKEVDQRLFDLTPLDQIAPTDRHCVQWFNFWIASDIVCDELGSYPIMQHHELELPEHYNLWSHSDYWTDPLFVRNILRIITYGNPKDLNKLKLITPEVTE